MVGQRMASEGETREMGPGRITRRTVLKRALALGVSAPVLSALLAACGGSSESNNGSGASGNGAGSTATSDTSGNGGSSSGERPTLRYGLEAADLSTLDPHFAATTNDRTVVDMVFNALIRYKPGDSSQFEPDLATEIPEPEIVDGKQVWTFTLRQGVMWHPGPQTESYELTADDVVFSLQKSANTDTSAYANDYVGMAVEKVDDYTVRITLDTPLSPVLFLPKVANYGGGFIMSQRAVEAMGPDAIKTHPVGTGPFRFQAYTPQNAIELIAWDDYFRGAPKLAGVSLRFTPDATSRELALQSGELDVAAGIREANWVDKINQTDHLQADVFGVGEVVLINFTMAHPPLDKVQVRQALAYAISREGQMALFGPPVVEESYSIIPTQFLPGGLTKEEAVEAGVAYETDLEKARALLAEAGLADGFTLEVISSDRESERKIYETLQAELKKIGVEVKLQIIDHQTFHKLIRDDANPIVVYPVFRPNPDVLLTQFFHSDSTVVTGAKPNINFSHYDQIDDLIEQARAETDADRQIALWKEANIKILTDMACHSTMVIYQVYGRSKKVQYGHELKSVLAYYPQITEQTTIVG